MTSTRRLAEAGWAVAGVFFSKIFPLIASLLLVRVLGPELYGAYSLTIATVNLLLAATGIGLAGGLVANLASSNDEVCAATRRQYVTSFMALNGALLSLTVAMAGAMAALGLVNTGLIQLAANWAPMLLLVVIQVFIAAQVAVSTATGSLKKLAGTSLIGGGLVASLQIAGGIWWGVAGALWGMLSGYTVQYLLQRRICANHLGSTQNSTANTLEIAKSITTGAWKDFMEYGKFMFASSILVSLGMWYLSYALLANGSGMKDVGAFGVLNHWKMILMFAPLAISNYLAARFTVESASRKGAPMLVKILAATSALLIPLVAATHFLAPEILRVYGSAYSDLTTELLAISIIALLASLNSIFGNFLVGLRKFKEGFVSNLVWFIFLLTSIRTIQENGFSVMDACISLAVAYIVHSIYQLIVFRNCMRSSIKTPLHT